MVSTEVESPLQNNLLTSNDVKTPRNGGIFFSHKLHSKSIDARIHIGLETQYILQLLA